MINTMIIIIIFLLLQLLLSFLLILLFCCFKYLSGEFFPFSPQLLTSKIKIIINSLYFLPYISHILNSSGILELNQTNPSVFFLSFNITLLLSSIFIYNGVVPFSSLLEVKGCRIYRKFYSFCYL